MFRFIFFLSAVFTLTSCRQNTQEPQVQQNTGNQTVDSVAVLNDPKNNLNIQMNSFSEIDSSGILMFPLSIGEPVRDGSIYDYKVIPGNSLWNIVFLNGKTNEYHLLSDKKMLIRTYDFNYSVNDNLNISKARRYIFYSIISDDYNKDKKLTGEDPTYLFVSDKEGKNLKQISPANYALQNWKFIKSINKVLITVKKDSDKNNKFDDKDELITFEVDVDKGSEPKEVFSTDFKNRLKILYDKDWNHSKK